jgi:hypothetical protein
MNSGELLYLKFQQLIHGEKIVFTAGTGCYLLAAGYHLISEFTSLAILSGKK